MSDLLGTGKGYTDRGLLYLDYRMGKLRQPSQGHTARKKLLLQTRALILGSDRQVPEAGFSLDHRMGISSVGNATRVAFNSRPHSVLRQGTERSMDHGGDLDYHRWQEAGFIPAPRP